MARLAPAGGVAERGARRRRRETDSRYPAFDRSAAMSPAPLTTRGALAGRRPGRRRAGALFVFGRVDRRAPPPLLPSHRVFRRRSLAPFCCFARGAGRVGGAGGEGDE